MNLNIKNEDTQRRAKELPRLAGETVPEAVDRAIAERLNRIRKIRSKASVVERLLKIGLACSRLPMLDQRTPEEMIYNPQGLPK